MSWFDDTTVDTAAQSDTSQAAQAMQGGYDREKLKALWQAQPAGTDVDQFLAAHQDIAQGVKSAKNGEMFVLPDGESLDAVQDKGGQNKPWWGSEKDWGKEQLGLNDQQAAQYAANPKAFAAANPQYAAKINGTPAASSSTSTPTSSAQPARRTGTGILQGRAGAALLRGEQQQNPSLGNLGQTTAQASPGYQAGPQGATAPVNSGVNGYQNVSQANQVSPTGADPNNSGVNGYANVAQANQTSPTGANPDNNGMNGYANAASANQTAPNGSAPVGPNGIGQGQQGPAPDGTRQVGGYGQSNQGQMWNGQTAQSANQVNPYAGQAPTQSLGNFQAPSDVPATERVNYNAAATPTAFQGDRQTTPTAFQYQQFQAPDAYKPTTAADLAADPSYQFRRDQGLGAIQNSAAAKGLLHSGATVKGLNDYAGQSASQEYANVDARRQQQYQQGFSNALNTNQANNAGNFSAYNANTANQLGVNTENYARGNQENQQGFQNQFAVNQANNQGQSAATQANNSTALAAQNQQFGQASNAYGLNAQNTQYNQGLQSQNQQYYAGLGQANQQFNQGQGQQNQQYYAGLNQQNSQFGQTLGSQNRQFDASLASQNRQFDASQDLSYLSLANNYDLGQQNVDLGYQNSNNAYNLGQQNLSQQQNAQNYYQDFNTWQANQNNDYRNQTTQFDQNYQLANLGYNASNQYANTANNAAQNTANANAASKVGTANAWNNTLGTIANTAQQSYYNRQQANQYYNNYQA